MKTLFAACILFVALVVPAVAMADVHGTYIEARTCQVYTGPCFANGEVGLTGHDAVMAWNIEEGQHGDVDLSGLKVVLVVKAEDTIGHEGLTGARPVAAAVMVDEQATQAQRQALVDFARSHAKLSSDKVVRVDAMPINMSLDTTELSGKVEAGDAVKMTTRKARQGDCICKNETAYYPPMVELQNFAPGVTIDSSIRARGLGSRWEAPGNRNVYMATFAY
jgi:hypothetical protein